MKTLPLGKGEMLNRRAFLPTVVGAAIAGSAVASLVVRSQPRLIVVGDERWQVALLLASRTRVLILTGELSQDAVAAIPMLLSVMRRRIDMVISPAAGLALLPDQFRERWMVRSIIPLPDDDDTSTVRPAPDRIVHLATDLRVAITSVPLGFWSESSGRKPQSTSYVVTVSRGRSVVAIAKSLDVLADLGAPSSTIAMAPEGDVDNFSRHLRVPTICINADQLRDQHLDALTPQTPQADTRSLVRIFPTDVAEFRLRHDGVSIPPWRQAITLS